MVNINDVNFAELFEQTNLRFSGSLENSSAQLQSQGNGIGTIMAVVLIIGIALFFLGCVIGLFWLIKKFVAK